MNIIKRVIVLSVCLLGFGMASEAIAQNARTKIVQKAGKVASEWIENSKKGPKRPPRMGFLRDNSQEQAPSMPQPVLVPCLSCNGMGQVMIGFDPYTGMPLSGICPSCGGCGQVQVYR